MVLSEAFTVLSVLAVFAFLIWAKLQKKNPEATQKVGEWFNSTGNKPNFPSASKYKQRYEEKRSTF